MSKLLDSFGGWDFEGIEKKLKWNQEAEKIWKEALKGEIYLPSSLEQEGIDFCVQKIMKRMDDDAEKWRDAEGKALYAKLWEALEKLSPSDV